MCIIVYLPCSAPVSRAELVQIFTEKPPFIATDTPDNLPVRLRDLPGFLSAVEIPVLINEALLGVPAVRTHLGKQCVHGRVEVARSADKHASRVAEPATERGADDPGRR